MQSVEFDLVIRACQLDVILHLGSSYCYNNKFITVYTPSHFIEKLWNKYFGSTVQRVFTNEEHILKWTHFNFSMHTISWVENHSNCIRNLRLCLGVWFKGFNLKQIKYLVQIFTVRYERRHNTSCLVYWEKHCVLHHQFQRGVIWIQKTTVW